jgi:hypothetical protein
MKSLGWLGGLHAMPQGTTFFNFWHQVHANFAKEIGRLRGVTHATGGLSLLSS